MRVRTLVAGISMTTAVVVVGAACDAFDSAPEGTSAPDTGNDATGSSDSPAALQDGATSDGASDASTDSCEVLVGQPFATAEAAVSALAADAVFVYWGSTVGTTRLSAVNKDAVPEPVFRSLGACTDVAIGDFVAARFQNNTLRYVSRTDIDAAATSPNISGSTLGLDPRSTTQFFARRFDKIHTCTLGANVCVDTVARGNATGVVLANPSGFDYIAPAGAAAGVFTCPSGCTQPDAGTQLASAMDLKATKIASDETIVFFLDPTAGAVRSVPRAGGAVQNVITGLVEPVDFAIDAMGRLVVATLVNGVFRGPKSGCVAPKTATSSATISGFSVAATTVWYAEGAAIKSVAP